MHRLRTLPVVLLVCAAALAGCSDNSAKKTDSTPSPSSASSSTSSTSSTASPSESASGSTTSPFPSQAPTGPKGPKFPTDRIEAASLHLAYLDSSVARSPEEKAVVAAWMDYWQGSADTLYLWKPTDKFLGVARGSAKSGILDYLAQLKKQNQRVVGWAKDNVTKVTVNGGNATLQDCTKNFTYTVDREMEHRTRPTPFYGVTGTLKKENGQWTVTTEVSKDLKKSCLS